MVSVAGVRPQHQSLPVSPPESTTLDRPPSPRTSTFSTSLSSSPSSSSLKLEGALTRIARLKRDIAAINLDSALANQRVELNDERVMQLERNIAQINLELQREASPRRRLPGKLERDIKLIDADSARADERIALNNSRIAQLQRDITGIDLERLREASPPPVSQAQPYTESAVSSASLSPTSLSSLKLSRDELSSLMDKLSPTPSPVRPLSPARTFSTFATHHDNATLTTERSRSVYARIVAVAERDTALAIERMANAASNSTAAVESDSLVADAISPAPVSLRADDSPPPVSPRAADDSPPIVIAAYDSRLLESPPTVVISAMRTLTPLTPHSLNLNILSLDLLKPPKLIMINDDPCSVLDVIASTSDPPKPAQSFLPFPPPALSVPPPPPEPPPEPPPPSDPPPSLPPPMPPD